MNLRTRPNLEAFHEPAADGYTLGGFTWRLPRTDLERPVVIINAAISGALPSLLAFCRLPVRQRFDVIAYDYRGIGESRSGSLRGL